MRDEELKPLLAALLEARAANPDYDALLTTFSEAWKVPADDVEFWLSAINSYFIRQAVPEVRAKYDGEHTRVFRLLEQLTGATRPGLWPRLRSWIGGKR
jgi:hypothetical protein